MRFQLLLLSVVVASALAGVQNMHGFDAIDSISESTCKCLYDSIYGFFIGRIQHSTGAVDNTGIQNIINCQKSGMLTEGYIFPCTTCSGTSQITNSIKAAKQAGAQMRNVFLDVEPYKWSSNKQSNQNLITSYINAGKKAGASMAIYTNENNWNEIVGDWDGCKNLILWYAHYDGKDNYNDFQPFGGWTSPGLKQYDQNKNCGCSNLNCDLNYKHRV